MPMPMPPPSLLALLPCALLLACGKDDSKASAGDSSSGTTAGDSNSTTMSVTVTTTASTSDSTTVTTGMTETTSTASPTTTDPDSSGTTDATTTDATTTDATTTDVSSSSSTGGVPSTYGPCDLTDPTNPTCEVEGEACNVVVPMNAEDPFIHFCGPTCVAKDPASCPAPESGDAIAACIVIAGDECFLNCAGMATCPDGMECVDFYGLLDVCEWVTPQ